MWSARVASARSVGGVGLAGWCGIGGMGWDRRGGVGLAGVGGWDWRGEVVGYVAYAEKYYSPEKNNFYPFICPSANGPLRKERLHYLLLFFFDNRMYPEVMSFLGNTPTNSNEHGSHSGSTK